MTKLELIPLIQRQRRFEWTLSRDQQARAATSLVGSRTHDLLNAIQIVDLASRELGRRVTTALPDLDELVRDLVGAADTAKVLLRELLAIARPVTAITRGAPVGPAVTAAADAVGEVEVRLEVEPEVATACAHDELEHLVIGLLLDAQDAGRVTLLVRVRMIERVRWLELVRGSERTPGGVRDELRVVSALVERHGGELAESERRGGGFELIVALPIV